MSGDYRFSVLVAPGQGRATEVISVLHAHGAMLRGGGGRALDFEIGAAGFAILFGAARLEGTVCGVPQSLRGLVDLVTVPPHCLMFG